MAGGRQHHRRPLLSLFIAALWLNALLPGLAALFPHSADFTQICTAEGVIWRDRSGSKQEHPEPPAIPGCELCCLLHGQFFNTALPPHIATVTPPDYRILALPPSTTNIASVGTSSHYASRAPPAFS